MNNENKTDNEPRAKIIGIGKLRVKISHNGKHAHPMRRKVLTKGILENYEFADEIGVDFKVIREIIAGIKRVARAGYEVRLGNEHCYVRFYPCLDRDYSTMFLASQTCEGLRNCVEDMKFEITHRGEEVDAEEAQERDEAWKSESEDDVDDTINVTPDTMITCPNCGKKFRVGKQLK